MRARRLVYIIRGMTNRIALSTLVALFLTACSFDAGLDDQPDELDGIGTSPSEPDVGGVTPAVQEVHRCGMWVSFESREAAELRHLAFPKRPDMVQADYVGGVDCGALQVAAEALERELGGFATVYCLAE